MNKKLTRKRPGRQGFVLGFDIENCAGEPISSELSKNRRRRWSTGEPGVSGFGGFACYTGIAPRQWKEKLFSLVVNPISMRRVFCAGPGANPVRDTQSHSCRRIGSKQRKETVWIADDES